MGIDIYVQFTGDPETAGVHAFGTMDDLIAASEWAAGVPRLECFAKLHELFDVSETTGTMDLSVEIEMALEEFPPTEDVRLILGRFLEVLGDGDDQEMIHIGDPDNDDAFLDAFFTRPEDGDDRRLPE